LIGPFGEKQTSIRSASKYAVEWANEILWRPVEMPLYGVTTKVPTLEAIVTVVSLQALAGDPRALALQMKFKEFAARRSESKVEIEFADNDYTRSLAAPTSTAGEIDE
jgi:hypothetical protein